MLPDAALWLPLLPGWAAVCGVALAFGVVLHSSRRTDVCEGAAAVQPVMLVAAAGAGIVGGATWSGIALAATVAAGSVAAWASTHTPSTPPRPVVPRPSPGRSLADRLVLNVGIAIGVTWWVLVMAGVGWWMTADATIAVVALCAAHALLGVPTAMVAAFRREGSLGADAAVLLGALLTAGALPPEAPVVAWIFPAYLGAASTLSLVAAVLGHASRAAAPGESAPWLPCAASRAGSVAAWAVLGGWVAVSAPAGDLGERGPVTTESAAPARAAALSPDDARLAVASFDDDTLSILDTSTGEVTATVAVGDGPHEVVWTPDGRLVLTLDVLAQAVSVVDVDRGRVAASLPVPSPVAIAMDASGTAYVSSAGTPTVTPIDPSALSP